MKRLALALGLVVAAAFAAPLAAQSRNDGPWWDPGNTAGRTDTRGQVDNRNGQIYNGGRVNGQADGQWRREGRDRNGNTIYVRTRYDSSGNLVREAATRNFLGQYRVVDRRVISYANNNRGNNGRYDNGNRDRNDRWDQNNGHDNGKHNGQYKNKGKNKRRD